MTFIRPMSEIIENMEAAVAAREAELARLASPAAERDRRFDLYLGCARRARRLAHGWLMSARNYPRYAETDRREAAKAFARARFYLGFARMIKAFERASDDLAEARRIRGDAR